MDTPAEQQAQLADIQMPMNRAPAARLKVVHAEIPLGQFKASFDRPAREGHPQHPFQRHAAGPHGHVGHEVFHIVRIENIASDDQRMRRPGQAGCAVLAVKRRVFDLPDDRAFLAVFDLESPPLLLLELTRINQQVLHFAGRKRLSRQSRVSPFSPAFMDLLWPGGVQNPRSVNPAGERRGNLANVTLPQGVEPVEELAVPAVPFVERPRRHANPIGQRPTDLVQGDIRFLSIHDIIGNTGFLATIEIVGPIFGQVQIAVEQTLKVAGRIRYMNADDTVVDLACVAAPLPLDRSGMGAFLGIAGIVYRSDSLSVSMVARYDPLDSVSYAMLVPLCRGEEALQRARRYAGSQGDGFDTFSWQVRDLPADVVSQPFPRLASCEAIVEFSQESLQFSAHTFDSFDVHVDTPYILRIYKELSRQAA